ncbi:PRC-barrel domain-containing protein [Microvirga arabica]|uniref:PRC-barrel domain-containing protein n=1 Tax=Microvirga arabica TaxID=1128671 RepID=UPI00193A9926|nr:PRC-barrel domain-containing protein [Microvirga arabica]MBM1172802.1 PRC-barrel domain-containing protein [Microvirga arabica]
MHRVLAATTIVIFVSWSACLSLAAQGHSSDATSAQTVYDGWRARQLLASSVLTKQDRRSIGSVRDLIVDRDGRMVAIVIEGGGPVQIPDTVYRVPWMEVDPTPGEAGVTVDLSDADRPHYGLVPGTEGTPSLPREFRITEVIGDYARLQAGQGFGYVTDVIVTKDNRLAAVLITRDGESSGRTIAFPFSGIETRWDPGASYFGLPHVTAEQAEQAAISIDRSGLSPAGL